MASKKVSDLCGHINKQFINKDGKRKDLPCDLPKGHEGDHHARFEHVVTDYGIEKGDRGSRQVVTGSHLEWDDAYWLDGAGEFPVPHVMTPEEDFQRLKDARTRERGTDASLSEKLDKEVRASYGG